MIDPLEEYLAAVGRRFSLDRVNARKAMAISIKKTERSIRGWLKEGEYKVDYDGRTLVVSRIEAKRVVYVRDTE